MDAMGTSPDDITKVLTFWSPEACPPPVTALLRNHLKRWLLFVPARGEASGTLLWKSIEETSHMDTHTHTD